MGRGSMGAVAREMESSFFNLWEGWGQETAKGCCTQALVERPAGSVTS